MTLTTKHLTVAILTALANTAFAEDPKHHFEIAAGSLDSALQAFAVQSGEPMLYAEQTISGKHSPRLSGNYTTREAAALLLTDSGLEYQVAADGTVTVKPEAKPAAPKPVENLNQTEPTELPAVKVPGKAVYAENSDSDVEDESPNLTTPSIADSKRLLNHVPGGTTLLEGKRIRETASYDVSDTLSYTPGLYATTGAGGFIGGGSRISMRGSDINSAMSPILGVKVLRDGMPITTANGATDTESINIYAIDHIEVYRGANAMQYGAAQLGGAINMISPTGYTAGGLRLGMTAGSYGFINPTFSAGKAFNNGLDVYGSFAYAASDNFRHNADEQHIYGYGNIGYRWNDDNETRFHVDISDHDNAQPDVLTKQQLEQDPKQNTAPSNQKFKFPSYRFALQHTTHLANNGKLNVGGYYYQKDFCLICDDYKNGHDEWKEVGFNLRHDFQYQLFGLSNQFTYGGLWQRMWIDDAKANRREDEDYFNQELFAENKMSLNDQLTFVLGLQSVFRNNENHRTFGALKFGDVDFTSTGGRASKDTYGFNPKAGLIWSPLANIQLFGNVSRSWEQPRIRQLQNFAQTPPLKEQTATTIEIGTRGKIDYLNWDLSFYHAWVDDEILVVESPPLSQNFITGNADASLHTGIELGLESTLPLGLMAHEDNLRLRGTYTWNNFYFDNDRSFHNNQLPGIPEHVGRFELMYQHPSGFSLGPTVQAASANWVDFANTLRADAYALLGVRIAYDTKGYRFFVEGRNLTDEHYASSVSVMTNAKGTDQAQFNPGSTASVFGGVELRW